MDGKAGGSPADPHRVPAPGSEIELGIKGDHPKDSALGNLQRSADVNQDLLREISVKALSFLEDWDQHAFLIPVLIEDRIESFRIQRIWHFYTPPGYVPHFHYSENDG